MLFRSTYQLNPANRREALADALLDEAEGADLLMVKPAGPYLDIISQIRRQSLLPLAAYQVSGEYAMIAQAAAAGALDRDAAMREIMLGFKRAGASAILTYAALDIARGLK